MVTELATALSAAEVDYLADCEETISHGLQTFIEVGTALAMIRDNRLYRAEFGTFEDYCQERWGIRRQRANELIAAARMVDEISSTGAPIPANEAQAVALSRVPDEQRAEVWRETVERTDGKPTAAAIRETYENTQTPAPMPEPGPEASTSTGPGHDLGDAMAEAIEQARERVAQQRAEREAVSAPREVVDAVNAATHFVPAMVAIQTACEDLVHRVREVDPDRAVADLPDHLRARLAVARDAHAYLTRVVDALDRIGVPA